MTLHMKKFFPSLIFWYVEKLHHIKIEEISNTSAFIDRLDDRSPPKVFSDVIELVEVLMILIGLPACSLTMLHHKVQDVHGQISSEIEHDTLYIMSCQLLVNHQNSHDTLVDISHSDHHILMDFSVMRRNGNQQHVDSKSILHQDCLGRL